MSFFFAPGGEELLLETGRVNLNGTIDGGGSASVTFTESFSQVPVVVTYIATRNGGQSVQCRAKNVTTNGCDIHMEEPDNENHNDETTVWIAALPGAHEVDGVQFEAATHTTSTVRNSGDGAGGGDTVTFAHSWGSVPAVVHNLQTYNNGEFMATQSNSFTTTNFNLSQEALETGNQTGATTEDIGWIAFQTGAHASVDGVTFDVGQDDDGANDGVDNTPHSISFAASFGSAPDIVVSGNSLNGDDGFYARSSGTQWNTSGHDVYAEEDQISDTERGHTNEAFGWVAADPNATVYG